MSKSPKLKLTPLLTSSLSLLAAVPFFVSALSGAIFTTTEDGAIVNENVRYQDKLDVYLDGGPRMNAPASAASLPDGDYYFQVTDPSGKDLLSSDHISCRKITINNGVITEYHGADGHNYSYKNGQNGGWIEEECTGHAFNTDVDHGGDPLYAMVIQLYPYDDTPNSGGVYKVWITPVDNYDPVNELDLDGNKHQAVNQEGYQAGNFHGFIPRFSKTDNYKVKQKRRQEYGIIALRNYHDANLNCRLDPGEKFIWGWEYGIDDGLGVRNTGVTQDESGGDPSTILMQEALGKLDDLWNLDHYRWTEDEDKNLNSQYFTTSGYAHAYQAFTSTNTGPEDPALWDEPSDYLERFLMEMVCLDAVDSGDGPQTANEFTGFTPSALGVVPEINNEDPQITLTLGQVGFANMKVTKIFDTNGNGVADDGEMGIPNWPVRIKYAPSLLQSSGGPVPDTISPTENADLYDEIIARFQPNVEPGEALLVNGIATRMTDSNGEHTFKLLLPNGYGDAPFTLHPSDYYQVEEASAQGWQASSNMAMNFDVRSEASGVEGRLTPIMGKTYMDDSDTGLEEIVFTNLCFNEVSFGTKGYWHNKNGLGEMEESFVTSYINTLDPYDSETSYFGAGDEPFDGKYSDNTNVDAAFNNDDINDALSAQAGTVKAEVSHFLVDSNGGGDPREQLAQQLLAFLFNVEYRLGGDAQLILSGGGTISAQTLIDEAIAAWQGTDATSQNEYKTQLDDFNNMKVGEEGGGVQFIPSDPANCPPLPSGFEAQ
ncbi:hypothetical protein [Shewanella sp. Isolate11]|uniref:hypothetical protein n=1 Tax=Shewanella sp. Isolate11 TaxID=2908530 RepID=UPI001EFE4781|nr:hypothetical protein [Shewanella sp. Isolate11]MCG9695554.1 hypothetical protein [Shewanella sp. Isolate11]